MVALARNTTLRFRRTLTAVCVLLALVACGTLVAPQQWDGRRGPVVPHDSFPADCRLCHTGDGWNQLREDFRFDHLKETGVPLEGAHASAECLRCHNDRGPVEVFADRGCAGCHVDPHRGNLGRNCRDCHGEATWYPRDQIARHAATRMPLVGAHAAAQCFQCHPGAEVGNFEGADPTCTNCHAADLARATQPNHNAQGWTVDCQRCHVPIGWRPARFLHPGSFPLNGGHAGLDCATCHGTSGRYDGLSTDCASCHLDDYQRTRDPDHAAGGFSTDCRNCHNVFGWEGARFDHPASFPLTGGHAGQRCSTCHEGGRYQGTPTDCIACHQDDFNRATEPNHQQGGFSQVCTECHGTNGWEGARFDHPASFPLSGGHAGRRCADCHDNGQYAGTPTDCTSCHRDDYNATTDPNHGQLAFPLDCLQCHDTTAWQNARFDHPTSFPLTNGHANRSCVDCHANGRYQGTPTDCVACHRDDYDRVTDPNHATYGFPLDCTRCHNTTTWAGATFTHRFPITSGAHRGLSCSQCHDTPSSPGSFTCTNCHEHTRSSMDSDHRGVNNYTYSTPECYRCHPNGRH